MNEYLCFATAGFISPSLFFAASSTSTNKKNNVALENDGAILSLLEQQLNDEGEVNISSLKAMSYENKDTNHYQRDGEVGDGVVEDRREDLENAEGEKEEPNESNSATSTSQLNDSRMVKYRKPTRAKATATSSISPRSIWNCSQGCYGISSTLSTSSSTNQDSTISKQKEQRCPRKEDDMDWNKIWGMEILDILKWIELDEFFVHRKIVREDEVSSGNILHLLCARGITSPPPCTTSNTEEIDKNTPKSPFYCCSPQNEAQHRNTKPNAASAKPFDLLSEVSHLHDAIQRVLELNVKSALERDSHGDLPLQLFVRYFWNWKPSPSAIHMNKKSNTKRLKVIAKVIRECASIVLEPVVHYLTLENAKCCGSVGTLLPIHIASMYGAPFQTLDKLLVVYPQGAATKCHGALPNLEPCVPLQLFERRRKTTHESMEKDEEERSSDLLEYFNRRSDHIFCFYPSVHPYCDDLLRLKRVQYLIRTEATVFGIPLSYAAEAMWIWLCTHQNTNVSSDSDSNNKDCNYAQIVEDIIRGLNLASFSKLNAIQTSSGQSIISIATKECVQVLKSYSLEIARNQLDVLSAHSNSSIHTSGTSVTSIMKLPNDIKNYTVVIPTNTSETDGGTSKLSSDSQVQNQSQTALSIVHPADSPKLKYIQMNIAPFTRRLFGVSTQHRLLPTTFIILPYKLIQHPITQAVTLLNPSSDSELAVEFARRLVQLQDINVIFYLLMEKIIAHQSMQEPPDGPHLEETCIDNLAWINSDLQTYFTYKEQQHIVTIIESFIQLFSCIEIGYLYLIDDITGTPIVIQSSSSSKEENPKDVYPIQIETPHETVRTVLSFMQIGMILMRGTDKAIYTLIQLLGRNLTPSSNCDSIFQLSTIKHKVVTEALSTSSCPSSSRQNSFLEMIPWLSNECYQQSFFKKARYTTSSIHWEDELSWIHHLCIDLNLQHVHLRPIETSNDNIIWSCESILKESSSSTSHTNHYPLLKKSKDDYKDGKEKQLHDAALEMKKELVSYSNTPTSFHEVGDFEEDITASHDDDDELHDGVDDNNVGDNTQKEESIVDVVLDVNHNNDTTTTTTTASPLSISSTASSSEDPANAADENEEQEQQIDNESIQDTISLESRGPTTRNASNTHHLSAFTNNNNIAQYNDNNEMDGNDDNESLMNNSTVLRYQITSDVMDKLNTIIANNSTNTPSTKTTRDMYDNNDADNESLMNNSTIQRQNKFSSNVTNRLTNLITNLSSRTTQTSSSYSIDNDELGSVLLSTQEQRLYNHNNNHHHHHRTLKIQDSSSSSIISKTSHTDKNRISSSSTNTTATDLKKQTARCKTSHNQHRKQQLHEQQRLERTTTTDSNNIQQQISFQSQVTATSTIRNKRLMNQVLRTDQVFRTDSYNVHTFGTEDEDMDDMISSKSSCTKHNDYNYDSSGKNKKMTAVMENDDDDDDYAVDHSSTNQHFIPTNVIEKLSRFVVSQGNQHQQTHDNNEQKQSIVPSKQHTNIMNTHTPNQRNHCYNVGNDKNTTTVSTTRAHNNAEVRYISQDKNNSRSRTKNNHHINDDINKIYPSTIATATTKRVSHYEDHHQQKNNNLDNRNTTSTTAPDKKIYSTTKQQPNPSSQQVQKQKQAPTIFKENNLTMTEKINKLANLKERNRLVPRIVNIKNPNAITDETSIVSGLTMNINDYSSSIASNTKQHTAAAALKLYNALQLQQQKQKLLELNDSNTTEIHMKVEDNIDEAVLSSSSASSKNSTRSNKKEQRQQSIPSQQQEHELTIPAGVKEQSLLLSKSDSFDKLVAALDEEDEILKRVIIQHEQQQEIIMNSSISSSSSKNHNISSSSSRVSNDKNALSS